MGTVNEARYCKSCGAYIPENKDHCVACGTPVRTNSGGSGGTGMASHLTLKQQIEAEIQKTQIKPAPESVLDLDGAEKIKVKFCGSFRDAYIVHRDYLPASITAVGRWMGDYKEITLRR